MVKKRLTILGAAKGDTLLQNDTGKKQFVFLLQDYFRNGTHIVIDHHRVFALNQQFFRYSMIDQTLLIVTLFDHIVALHHLRLQII